MTYTDIIQFWYEELSPQDWWKKNDELDNKIKERFLKTHQQAAVGELFHWRQDPWGRLAEVIVLDQFSRNMFRNTAQAFAYDSLALILSQEAVHSGDDQKIPIKKRSFIYMPYMHSESALIHRQAEILFKRAGLKQNYEFELKHKLIIDRFGRYPHRNQILNRQSTAEELEFLKQPGSSF